MEVSIYSILPFTLLLLSIAVLPFIRPDKWEDLYPYVSVSVSLLLIIYYFSIGRAYDLLHSFEEYFMFISLLSSLFIISGGVMIDIKGFSTPVRNVILLAAGALIANFAGTTGASMLLIRPYIKFNKIRLSAYHIVFFIFIVSNIGGSLTPIGDPPLFIGYLKGVPFIWMLEHGILIWLLSVGFLLTVFYFIDRKNFNKQSPEIEKKEETSKSGISIRGWNNLLLMVIVLISVFVREPHFLREAIMIVCAIISYNVTHKDIHHGNYFNFHPIKEVAWLFAGLFITVTPVMELLNLHSGTFGLTSPTHFYWLTGVLSSFLDNAPAYLTFLSSAMGGTGYNIYDFNEVAKFAYEKSHLLLSISISSVFFGAFTYLGNGPNFMIKNVAQSYGVKLPGFFGFISRYSLPILLPLFIIVWLLFIH